MTHVAIHTYAELRQYTDGSPSLQLNIGPGQTIAQVLARLGIPRERTRIIFVDGRAADLDRVLHGGERIDLFSAIGGG
jgi:sulfur carrier protein ThiS